MTNLSAILFLAAAACDIDVPIGESETAAETVGASTGAGGGTMDPGGDTVDPGGDTMDAGEDTMDPGEDTDPGDDTTGPDKGGGGGDCDLLVQDCPVGEACYSDGGAPVCAEEGDGQEGDPCELINACAPGLICTADGCATLCDPADPTGCPGGVCNLLGGSEGAGVCVPGETDECSPEDLEFDGFCFARCDPFLQDCILGEGCYPINNSDFVCIQTQEGGVDGSCEFLNACQPGQICVSGDLLPGDLTPGGCASGCDVSDSSCEAGLECVAYFEEGEAPLGYENFGTCILPS